LNSETYLGALFIDLDGFKALNDSLGHQAGNECLEKTVLLIADILRNRGRLYRYGGDEFVIVLPNFDCLESEATAERVRRRIDEANLGGRVRVTASIGVASSEHLETHDARALIDLADKAMYVSKHGGKNRVSIHGGPVPRGGAAQRPAQALESTRALEKELLRGRKLLAACPKRGAAPGADETWKRDFDRWRLAIEAS